LIPKLLDECLVILLHSHHDVAPAYFLFHLLPRPYDVLNLEMPVIIDCF
jgi:hypothetical protein